MKAEYKEAADFFTTRHKFFLLSGRHPYKPLLMTIVTGIYVMCAVAVIGVGALTGLVFWLSRNGSKDRRRRG